MNIEKPKGRGYCLADECKDCLDHGNQTDCEMLKDLQTLSGKEVERHFEVIRSMNRIPQAGVIFV